MSLVFLTDRNAVLAAMKEFDRRTRDGFLAHYGYGRALDYFIRHNGQLYDSKAIAGVAVGRQTKGPPLTHKQLNGGQATVVRKLKALGFEVISLKDAGRRQPPPQAATAASSPVWKLVTNQRASHRAFDNWRADLVSGAEPRGVRSFWRDDVRLRITCQDDGRTQLATEDGPGDWTVELNAPGLAGDANRLSAVAHDPDGRLWVLRQARLQLKGRGAGAILEREFLDVTGLEPVPVQVGSGPSDRTWLRVCALDQDKEEMLAEVARFVAYCQLVRDQRGPGKLTATALTFVRGLLAGPEVMGYLRAKARPAMPARNIWKAQAEVWQALSRQLAKGGRKLEKRRPAPGFEVDGFVRGRRPVLIEVKTSCAAVDVYTGLGQLILYHRMLELPRACRRVLLLPAQPSAGLVAALKAEGITVSVYDKADAPVGKRIRFEPALLKMCSA